VFTHGPPRSKTAPTQMAGQSSGSTRHMGKTRHHSIASLPVVPDESSDDNDLVIRRSTRRARTEQVKECWTLSPDSSVLLRSCERWPVRTLAFFILATSAKKEPWLRTHCTELLPKHHCPKIRVLLQEALVLPYRSVNDQETPCTDCTGH